MLILNKSKRIIDGIKPMQTVEIEDERALKLIAMYGKEIENLGVVKIDNTKLEALKSENEKLKTEIENLKAKIEVLNFEISKDKEINGNIEDLHKAFRAKFDKEVPRNMSNNVEWIKAKLEE